MSGVRFSIDGIGAWGSKFANWDALQEAILSNQLNDQEMRAPKAEIIPATERRRAPVPVKLAIEASTQACANAGAKASSLASVFVSGLGDTQLTDYMCKVLASDNKALSPTKFHNSVHNAAAGYWTISTECMQASNSIAGYQESASMALLESILQANAESRSMLVTFYDAPVSPVLKPLLKNEQAFAFAIVLTPDSDNGEFELTINSQASNWPTLELPDDLQRCYRDNPAAKSLALAPLLARSIDSITLPISEASSITIDRVLSS